MMLVCCVGSFHIILSFTDVVSLALPDILLTEAMSIFMISISWLVAGIIVMSTILPWVIFAIVPVTSTYAALLYYYRLTGIDMQRLDAKARSPVQALVSEGMIIRVFNTLLEW